MDNIFKVNFKSNIRKYILFFVSNIIAVAELFIFWGLNDVVVRAVTEPSIMMGIKSDFMIAVGLITVVTILLMVFSMRYYIKLRAKDYGTFIMLGMKKKMSYMLLFAEYIIGCIGSLLIGILSGNLLLYGILYCLNQYNPQIITLQKVDPVVYKNTILLCLGVMLGIFIILLVWMDGRNLSSLMMKEEITEKRPVSSKWLLFTVLGIVFIILAIKQYKPGTWGYYFAHIYFLIGGILIITFSGAFILEQAKKGPFYFRYALKINQLDSKYQSNILIILMLFVIHFFALSYIGTQIVEILPLDKTSSNYPCDYADHETTYDKKIVAGEEISSLTGCYSTPKCENLIVFSDEYFKKAQNEWKDIEALTGFKLERYKAMYGDDGEPYIIEGPTKLVFIQTDKKYIDQIDKELESKEERHKYIGNYDSTVKFHYLSKTAITDMKTERAVKSMICVYIIITLSILNWIMLYAMNEMEKKEKAEREKFLVSMGMDRKERKKMNKREWYIYWIVPTIILIISTILFMRDTMTARMYPDDIRKICELQEAVVIAVWIVINGIYFWIMNRKARRG